MKLKKELLEDKIEGFIYKKIEDFEYDIKKLNPIKLLTWNRLDLAFKLLYLDLIDKNNELAKQIYFYDIKIQTKGNFTEYGNEEKDSFIKYEEIFLNIFNIIKEIGFDSNKSIIPLSEDGSIYNGAHRVASAIYLNKQISCVYLKLKSHIADYNFFYKRKVPIFILEHAVVNFIENANNVHLAFLWPSGSGHKEKVQEKFSKILYIKELKLTPVGGYNLLFELYKHMDWIGVREKGFQGIKQKLLECFPNFEKVKVIAFQSNSIEDIKKIKEDIRKIYNIGFSSIHITDTKEEAVRISKLIFNKNGVHFLNHAIPDKFPKIYKKLDLFEKYLLKNNIDKNDVILDGSLILALYGIRKNEDIDYLISNRKNKIDINTDFEQHDSELMYHCKSKKNLIYNPKFYFQYRGFKFISFLQLYNMKKERNGIKDINDCNIMDAFSDNNKLKEFRARMNQNIFYYKIKTKRNLLQLVTKSLKVTGTYEALRWGYRKIKYRR